jgi:hypothetical protein
MDAKTPGQVIKGLTPGKFANLCKIVPAGSLEARKLTTGTALYWRVTNAGKTDRVAKPGEAWPIRRMTGASPGTATRYKVAR